MSTSLARHTKETDAQINPIKFTDHSNSITKKAIGLKRFLGYSYFKAIEQNPSRAKSLSSSCNLLKSKLLFTKTYSFY